MDKQDKIYVAGHNGMVGSAILRRLEAEGFYNIVIRTSKELNLQKQADVETFFGKEKPAYVFLAAAKVGGILANSTYKAKFIYDNIMISANVINCAYKTGVKKLLNLGSSCIYPRLAPQPLKEKYLLMGELEPTNEPYAIAKISAIKLCRYFNEQYSTNYISVMPTNLYGPNDNYDLETSHVLPALIRKFHEAKISGRSSLTLWGTGTPYREFLYVDDLAEACVFLMKKYSYSEIGEFINIGTGKDLTIKELSKMIQNILGFQGEVIWDVSKPDGTPKKLLDVSHINAIGWKAKTNLEDGISKAYKWYKEKAG
jgi:GDP-L-fucose synthase